jgi:hypothetical protein
MISQGGSRNGGVADKKKPKGKRTSCSAAYAMMGGEPVERGGRRRREKVRKAKDMPWSVYICTIVYEQSDDHVVSTGTSGMEREHAVDNRIDGLAMR